MLHGNDTVCMAKDVEYKTNEVSEKSPDCMGCSSASGRKRQRHNGNQQHKSGQAAQKRESVVRERAKGEKGKVEMDEEKRQKEQRKERKDREGEIMMFW